MINKQDMCCSEATLLSLLNYMQVKDKDNIIKCASGFCGGMGVGDTCGVVSAAIIAIGIYCDHVGDPHRKAKFLSKDFIDQFTILHKTVKCNDLLLNHVKGSDSQQIYCQSLVASAVDVACKLIKI